MKSLVPIGNARNSATLSQSEEQGSELGSGGRRPAERLTHADDFGRLQGGARQTHFKPVPDCRSDTEPFISADRLQRLASSTRTGVIWGTGILAGALCGQASGGRADAGTVLGAGAVALTFGGILGWRALEQSDQNKEVLPSERQLASSPTARGNERRNILRAGFRKIFPDRDAANARCLALVRANFLTKHDHFQRFAADEEHDRWISATFVESIRAFWQAMAGDDRVAQKAHILCVGSMCPIQLSTYLKMIEGSQCAGAKTVEELRWLYRAFLAPEEALFASSDPAENAATLRRIIRKKVVLVHPDKYNQRHIQEQEYAVSLLARTKAIYNALRLMLMLLDKPYLAANLSRQEGAGELCTWQ